MDRRRKILLSVLYWIAVLIVSLAILVGLILLLESRDSSQVDGGTIIAPWAAAGGFARPA
jgi:hypothetical protein